MTLIQTAAERRVTLNDVSWAFYQQMLREVGDGHVRLTFDQGRLEIMSPGPTHEQVKKILARIIEAYADVTGMDAEGLGSTTFSREDLQKGLEPDECYYIANPSAVLGKDELDLTVDPPPDLAIEIDISPPDVARQPIYGALGVPEVWRYDGQRVHLMHRQPNGTYAAADRSRWFPNLPPDRINEFIQIGLKQGQAASVRALRAWLQSQQ